MTDELEQALAALVAGKVIGLPTETVYGLAADATNPLALERIFTLKGRPKNHPLILHLGDASWLDMYCREVPETVRQLARTFWPGPLTMILKRNEETVLDAVTGGLSSVAVRVPAHRVALQVLRELGRPLAAPSANRFGAVSPTTKQHVVADFENELDVVLEGGPCEIGLESTIVDLTRDSPRLLRPGRVTRAEIQSVLSVPVLDDDGGGPRAPGTLPSHYAPRARVELCASESQLERRLRELGDSKVGVLHSGSNRLTVSGSVFVEDLSDSDELFAHKLYAALRTLDEAGCDVILSCLPAATGLGEAIVDRMTRAAAPRAS